MADTKKYLDLVGLRHYDDKIKTYINDGLVKKQDTISDLADIRLKAGNGQTAYNAWVSFLSATPAGEVSPKLADLALAANVYAKTEVYTKTEVNDAITAAKNSLIGDASDAAKTLGAVEGLISALDERVDGINTAIESKNVSAEGETGDAALVSASASANKVTVASTKKLQDAVALAGSALQDVTVATGDNNGEIKVQGHTVAVKGLGSAAYTDSTAYDASGAADGALATAKTYAESQAADAQAAAEKVATDLNTAMDARVVKLEGDQHNHANLTELNKIAEGDKAKWDTATGRINTFLDSKEVAGTVDTLHEIQAWMNGEGVNATELTEAIAAEAKLRKEADQAINDKIGTVTEGQTVVKMIEEAQTAAEATAAADATSKANAAQAAAEAYTVAREKEIDKKWADADALLKTNLEKYADDAESAAIASAKEYADSMFVFAKNAISNSEIDDLFKVQA